MPSPPHSPSPSGIVRPSTRSGSRMSIGSGRHFIATTLTTAGRAPSRASGEEEDGMRTAVRVAVRIRPPLRPEDPGYDLIPQRFQRSMVQTMSNTSLAVESPQGRKVFVFDRIFGPDVHQEGVWDYLQDSINAFVQGYNVSVLAYGQSGAGKSYTMGTSDPNEHTSHDSIGVIPRAAQALFEKLAPAKNHISGLKGPSRYSTPLPGLQKSMGAVDKPWSMKATYVEIYNEQLRDLLLPENTPPMDRRQVNIREDTKGRILLTGLQEMQIESVDDLLSALNFGSSIRQTDATAINAKSSRSHAVFSINLIQRKARAGAGRDAKEKRYSAPADILATGSDGFITVDSKLHFVDLAGSERLKNTGAHGDRAKEGISINAGLASLGKVISQLSSRHAGSHVSYRDSKLTRLLQDSLGGNAFTYMVACVNPAEFHLSETLNTVQYAQRARAIQSKPQIQEVAVDGDLRALVERLRTEITFLRNQIQSSNAPNDVPNRHSVDRTTEKQAELQNQILDLQENYAALSQRHAKLISEITKARDTENSNPTVRSIDVAEDRLARSNSFAEAVEQVVLEYEKTIQSLETSLSSTRSNLSSTESSLLEKEARLVYVETINSQLQSRIQKLVDRESSTEVYLADLESRLNGHTNGEERSSAAITELRKELSKVRENEASCEDYISTLEERLAEADQSMEVMQRELERLEHVVERQRSLGKLDNLLHELDTLTHVPSVSGDEANDFESKVRPESSQDQNGLNKGVSSTQMEKIIETPNTVDESLTQTLSSLGPDNLASTPGMHSPVSSARFAESNPDMKLQRTLADLDHYRGLYQTTMTAYSEMASRYDGVLRDLHELQDQLDEQQQHVEVGILHTEVEQGTPSSPQSVSTPLVEQISQQKANVHFAQPHTDIISPEEDLASSAHANEPTHAQQYDVIRGHEIDANDLMDLTTEFTNLERQYLKLQEEHKTSLELVDELKASISKSRAENMTSPTGAQILRRKSSQNLMAVDRANRAFKGLRSLAIQYMDGNEDALDAFDVNMNAAIHELHSRSERIQELEQEVHNLRKDTEAKTALINGLARERSSITTSPMDISVVSSLQERLAETEQELERVSQQLKSKAVTLMPSSEDPSTPKNDLTESRRDDLPVINTLSQAKAVQDEDFMCTWGVDLTPLNQKDGGDPLEQQLIRFIQFVETIIGKFSSSEIFQSDNTESLQVRGLDAGWGRIFCLLRDRLATFQEQFEKHTLQIEDKQVADNSHVFAAVKLSQILIDLRTSRHGSGTGIDQQPQSPKIPLDTKEAVMNNYSEIVAEISVLKEELKTAQKFEQDIRAELDEEKRKSSYHTEKIKKLEDELITAQKSLDEKVKALEDAQSAIGSLEASVGEFHSRRVQLESELENYVTRNKELDEEVTRYIGALSSQKELLDELKKHHEISRQERDELVKKEASHVSVIDQLEQQLASTYDQHQDAQRQLHRLQEELTASTEERASLMATQETLRGNTSQHIDSLNTEISALQAKLADTQLELAAISGGAGRAQRSNSVSSMNLRKSASTASLPSPPPVIPLPPLPPSQTAATTVVSSPAISYPAPPGTPTVSRRPSKDYVATHLEDQEARIKTLEKQLQAEKALTATLEEALTDCEKTMKKLNTDREMYQRKANQVQQELDRTRNESQSSRYSMQAMEDERLARLKAEKAKEALEERMQALSSKKKSRNFTCF